MEVVSTYHVGKVGGVRGSCELRHSACLALAPSPAFGHALLAGCVYLSFLGMVLYGVLD
jgi:hypothetical protein